jgi:hypothetical protein
MAKVSRIVQAHGITGRARESRFKKEKRVGSPHIVLVEPLKLTGPRIDPARIPRCRKKAQTSRAAEKMQFERILNKRHLWIGVQASRKNRKNISRG